MLSNDVMDTGCSAEFPKTTVAIASATAPGQIPAALEMASKVLRDAARVKNHAHLVCFGTSLSRSRVRSESSRAARFLSEVAKRETEAISGVTLDGFHLIVGPADLHVLQFAPNAAVGQLCRPTDRYEDVQSVVDCLARPIADGLNDASTLPPAWARHQHNVNFLTYFRDLWKETTTVERASGETDATLIARIANPRPALALAMFAKAASIAVHVCELSLSLMTSTVAATKGAEGLGLLTMFSSDSFARPRGSARDGAAADAREFLEQYLVGDEAPWAVNRRGEDAAVAAEQVLDRLFSHADRVARLALHAKLVATIPSERGAKTGLLVIDCSNNGSCARLIAGRVPRAARAVDGALEIEFEDATDDWVNAVNNKLFTAVDALLSSKPRSDESTATKAAAAPPSTSLSLFTALASSYLRVPDDLKDADLDSLLLRTSGARDLVTTSTAGLVAHVFSELVIHRNRIERAASGAHALVQRGPSVSCTFATFCPTVAKTLETKAFNPAALSSIDVGRLQEELNAIAKSIDRPYRPLGSLIGVISAEVEFNGARRRLVFWRRRGEGRESIATFLPAEYVDVAFADYATGSRRLIRSEATRSRHDPRPPMAPLFAADSLFSLSTASVLRDSGGLAFSIPSAEKAGFLSADESELYLSYTRAVAENPAPNTEIPSALDGSFVSFFIRESVSDRLCGLRVAWQRSARAGDLFSLVSDNSEYERVAL